MNNSLKRFTDAQENSYAMAFSEIQQGKKKSHWMWFIFPQIAGLGFSETSRYYAIKDLQEATDFLKHPVLGPRLINISRELLKLKTNDPHQVFGSPDDLKLQSSMTLFSMLPDADPVFQWVLEKFFNSRKDIKTLRDHRLKVSWFTDTVFFEYITVWQKNSKHFLLTMALLSYHAFIRD